MRSPIGRFAPTVRSLDHRKLSVLFGYALTVAEFAHDRRARLADLRDEVRSPEESRFGRFASRLVDRLQEKQAEIAADVATLRAQAVDRGRRAVGDSAKIESRAQREADRIERRLDDEPDPRKREALLAQSLRSRSRAAAERADPTTAVALISTAEMLGAPEALRHEVAQRAGQMVDPASLDRLTQAEVAERIGEQLVSLASRDNLTGERGERAFRAAVDELGRAFVREVEDDAEPVVIDAQLYASLDGLWHKENDEARKAEESRLDPRDQLTQERARRAAEVKN